MNEVVLYTKERCPLCDEAKDLLLALQETEPFQLNEIDIYSDDKLLEEYQLMIPVVQVNGEMVDYGQINLFNVQEKLDVK